MVKTKKCSRCQEVKDISRYYKKLDGKTPHCKECNAKSRKIFYSNNRDYELSFRKNYYKHNEEKCRNRNLKKSFGITIEQYKQMFINQNQSCFICKRHQSEFKLRLAVDHCHKTGKIRSLLCSGCNTFLGRIENNPNIISEFTNYINKFK